MNASYFMIKNQDLLACKYMKGKTKTAQYLFLIKKKKIFFKLILILKILSRHNLE